MKLSAFDELSQLVLVWSKLSIIADLFGRSQWRLNDVPRGCLIGHRSGVKAMRGTRLTLKHCQPNRIQTVPEPKRNAATLRVFRMLHQPICQEFCEALE